MQISSSPEAEAAFLYGNGYGAFLARIREDPHDVLFHKREALLGLPDEFAV